MSWLWIRTKFLFRLLGFVTAFTFTMFGTFTFLMMSPNNDYTYCWFEKIHVIRVVEFTIGLYSTVFMGIYIITEMKRSVDEEVYYEMERAMEKKEHDL